MAYSQVEYTGDGSQTQFSIPFPYLNKSHVKVYVDRSLTTVNWIDESTIEFDSAPASESIIQIKRNSSPDSRLVDFVAASVLREKDLDKMAKQLFYLFQENIDKLGKTLKKDYLGVFDAGNTRIKNIAPAQNSNDAMTKEHYDNDIKPTMENNVSLSKTYRNEAYNWAEEEEDVGVYDSAQHTGYSAYHHSQKAKDAKSGAETAESNAQTYKNDAQSAKNTAQTYRDESFNWAEEAEDTQVDDSAGHSGYSAYHHSQKAQAAQTRAETAESNAQTYKNDAQDARDKAQLWAEESEDVEVESGKYSAKHHAAKSEQSASNAATSESNAQSYANDAQSYRDTTQTYKNTAQDYRDDAHQWAEEAEGTEFTDSDGNTGYSAYHHSQKAQDAQSGAETAESNAQTHANDAQSYKNTAQTYRDEAYNWAEEAEDVQVEDSAGHTGYSAYHWAQKAEANSQVETATETTEGKVELATTTEAKNGTDDQRAMTPANVHEAFKQYGWGQPHLPLESFTNAQDVPIGVRCYYYNDSTYGYCYLINIQSDVDNHQAQIRISQDSDRMWIRRKTGGTWYGWFEITGYATQTVKGMVELTSQSEAENGADNGKAMTPADVRAAFTQYGLGENTTEETAEAIDCNLVSTTSIKFIDGANSSNVPSDFSSLNFYLITYVTNSDSYRFQYAICPTKSEWYQRRLDNGSWTDWGLHGGMWLTYAASNGYMFNPNGIIFMWGSVEISADTTTNVALPATFPNSHLHAMVSGASKAGNNYTEWGWSQLYFGADAYDVSHVRISNYENETLWCRYFSIGH